MRFFLADTETTGVGADDAVCEIAWAEVDEDLNVLQQDAALINPGKPIHYAASAVNGITDAMVADAPSLEEYMASVGHPLFGDDVVFCAHNAAFDFRFLRELMHGDTRILCTLKVARRLYPDAANHKQGTLAAMLGIEVAREKAHSADGDIDVLLKLVKQMCADAGCGLSDLLHIQSIPLIPTKIPFGKHKGTKLTDLPKSYVSWLLEKATNLDPDLRTALSAL
jgi:DNA polymerase III alpha subunit (gram-positive type)